MKYLLLILLFGCEDHWSEPYQKCLEDESYVYTTMILVGKIMIPQNHTGRRCKKYSNDFYISHGNDVFVLMHE